MRAHKFFMDDHLRFCVVVRQFGMFCEGINIIGILRVEHADALNDGDMFGIVEENPRFVARQTMLRIVDSDGNSVSHCGISEKGFNGTFLKSVEYIFGQQRHRRNIF